MHAFLITITNDQHHNHFVGKIKSFCVTMDDVFDKSVA